MIRAKMPRHFSRQSLRSIHSTHFEFELPSADDHIQRDANASSRNSFVPTKIRRLCRLFLIWKIQIRKLRIVVECRWETASYTLIPLYVIAERNCLAVHRRLPWYALHERLGRSWQQQPARDPASGQSRDCCTFSSISRTPSTADHPLSWLHFATVMYYQRLESSLGLILTRKNVYIFRAHN